MRFRYPMLKRSLRSGLEGYQYYNIALEMVTTAEKTQRIVHLDYVYSSTCPCSLELSEHARRTRRQIATPHSQRSVARVSVELVGEDTLWFEDLVELCNAAIPTETQVMVKREDEQAFAELNGSNPIFVEDAVRLLCDRLEREPRIGDFRVVASHQELLHSHDAVSILTKGETFRQVELRPAAVRHALPRRLTAARPASAAGARRLDSPERRGQLGSTEDRVLAVIDIRPVGYIVGWLVLGLGLLMVLPLALDLADGDGNAGAFALSAVLSILIGAGGGARLRRRLAHRPQPAAGLHADHRVLGRVHRRQHPAADARRARASLHRRALRDHLGDDHHRRHGDRRPRRPAARRAALARAA